MNKENKDENNNKEAGPETVSKLDDKKDRIVDPMARFKDQDASISYADRLLILFEHEEGKEAKGQTKVSDIVKDIKPQEVKIQNTINVLEQNEDWTDSDDEDEKKNRSKTQEKEKEQQQ